MAIVHIDNSVNSQSASPLIISPTNLPRLIKIFMRLKAIQACFSARSFGSLFENEKKKNLHQPTPTHFVGKIFKILAEKKCNEPKYLTKISS